MQSKNFDRAWDPYNLSSSSLWPLSVRVLSLLIFIVTVNGFSSSGNFVKYENSERYCPFITLLKHSLVSNQNTLLNHAQCAWTVSSFANHVAIGCEMFVTKTRLTFGIVTSVLCCIFTISHVFTEDGTKIPLKWTTGLANGLSEHVCTWSKRGSDEKLSKSIVCFGLIQASCSSKVTPNCRLVVRVYDFNLTQSSGYFKQHCDFANLYVIFSPLSQSAKCA